VGAGAIGLLLWHLPNHADRHDLRRWSHGGAATESDDFKLYAGSASGPRAQDSMADRVSMPVPNRPLSLRRPHFSVYSVPNIHPPHPHATLRDLGDQGQARAISLLEHETAPRSHAWDDLRKAMSDEEEPGERDPFLFERILVATVMKGVDWEPGDRMMWTRVFVKPINFRFANYTVAATENETVKVSSVEATNLRKFSADIGLAIPGLEGPKLGLGPSSEQSFKTTSDVSTQYEQLGIDIMPEFLRMVRESAAGGDVVGNTKVAVSLTTDPTLIHKQTLGDETAYEDKGDIALIVTEAHLADDQSQSSIKVLPQVPLPHCPLRAQIWALYEQRHIDAGREYYDEARHQVTFRREADLHHEVTVMSADEVSPTVWKIQIVERNEQASNFGGKRQFLSGRRLGGGSYRELVFSDYGRASQLAHWVRSHPGKPISELVLNYNGSGESAPSLVAVKTIDDECRRDDRREPDTRIRQVKATSG
jgi:hypothetical protein